MMENHRRFKTMMVLNRRWFSSWCTLKTFMSKLLYIRWFISAHWHRIRPSVTVIEGLCSVSAPTWSQCWRAFSKEKLSKLVILRYGPTPCSLLVLQRPDRCPHQVWYDLCGHLLQSHSRQKVIEWMWNHTGPGHSEMWARYTSNTGAVTCVVKYDFKNLHAWQESTDTMPLRTREFKLQPARCMTWIEYKPNIMLRTHNINVLFYKLMYKFWQVHIGDC